jgi:dihydrofolate reductase
MEATRGDDRAFVTGGSEIYALFLPEVSEILLTRVHVNVEGDTHLPEIDWVQWRLVTSVRHEADEKNDFPFSFEVYQRT